MTTYLTNAAGIKFYIEPAGSFDGAGRACAGRGFFAGLVVGKDEIGGVFFETKEQALDAISAWRG